MTQKTYKFKAADGNEIVKTLVKPTNKNIIDFLALLGKKNFKELLTPEGQADLGIYVLDLAVDLDKLKQMLDVCLDEGSDGLDLGTIDMREVDPIVQDFFDQRAKMLLEHRRS